MTKTPQNNTPNKKLQKKKEHLAHRALLPLTVDSMASIYLDSLPSRKLRRKLLFLTKICTESSLQFAKPPPKDKYNVNLHA